MTKVREFITRWDRPADRTWVERDREAIVGAMRGSARGTPKFRPFDMLREPRQALVLWQNDDMRIGVESVVGAAPEFRRNCDYDELFFQFAGHTTLETEYGVFEMGPAELLLVPGGIAHRSSGDGDSLRLFARLRYPVETLLGVDQQVSHTEFDVIRTGGPRWPGNGSAPDTHDAVRERLLLWDDATGEGDLIERNYASLVGVATEGRGIAKLRAFDFFQGITGKGGAGPKLYQSPVFHVEVYNTEGEQRGFHRGLDDDELWLQFRGDSANESEFGVEHLGPGEMNHVPPGIAHRVIGGEGFLRLVLYSRQPWKLMVDPTQHAHQSTFESRERVLQAAAWKA
ncbi:MAG TPA: hypothetical protein VK066_03950 [Chloroflexota bacterium]|nr:hypothetical protein [Chloroflexota bacterium]